jgi:2-iminobutanoate/2-iminopropanoate deaminase
MRRAVGAPGHALASYSPGVVAEGRFVFVSGQLSVVDGRFVAGTIEEEVANAIAGLAAVLAEAGAGLDDVVRCTVYLADLTDFPAMDAEYRRHLSEPLPARTTIGVQLGLGAKVEIDCIALAPG